MRIAVFGASGQIGSALVDHLSTFAGNPHTVTAVCREGRAPRFSREVAVRTFAALDSRAFEEVLRDADHVIYSIGSPEQWTADPGFFTAVNVGILEAFLAVLARHPGISLTYLSTFEVFEPRAGIIRESHPPAARGATPYYQSMLDAYRLARSRTSESGTPALFIHPAAVYGGRNTGMGLTDYILNLEHRRFWRVPAVPPGLFPLVHVDSLADGVRRALAEARFGESYLFADAHLSLRGLAEEVRGVRPSSYRPMELPLPLIHASVGAMELIARATRRPPLMSRVQVKYLTQGLRMDCAKAERELGWRPMPVRQGLGTRTGA